MKTLKLLKDKRIQIGVRIFKPYCISDLPNNFGCIGFERDEEGNIVKYGVSEWFAFKGFTYIPEK